MKIPLLIIAILLTPDARAELRQYQMGIEMCPNLVFESGVKTLGLKGWYDIIPPAERPNSTVIVPSSWTRMHCEVKDDSFMIVVDIPAEDYPLEQLPSDAICTATDTRGNVHRVHVHPTLLEASDPACWERDDAWYADPALIYAWPDSAGTTSLPLLPGHNFVDGTYQAKRDSGTDWSGVTCKVEDGQQMIVYNTATAVEDTGYCPLPDGQRGTAHVPFSLVHVE
ncbi:hypothetical protein KJ673_01215 [Patescibacteria group bacterium]|nr:hypothetical protein [Patescibacteria group bacterium]MBU4452950.1 hypothetical protein [Patescibacteria group bacterium]